MNKLKKAAAVAVMVGGLGLVGSGVASATGGHDYDDPFPFAIDNLQVVDCEQEFAGGAAFAPGVGAVGGDSQSNIGNFCTVIGSVEG
ncbi:Secreted protein OS=Streptomyces aurantiogriseus OX=66870 GN=GCM10010251_70830 PE=4 SV=1 [Streptomyces aurantiogriseus]